MTFKEVFVHAMRGHMVRRAVWEPGLTLAEKVQNGDVIVVGSYVSLTVEDNEATDWEIV